MLKPAALFCMLVLGGCAVAPVSDDVGIETLSGGQPLPGASCTVQTVEGSYSVLTPAAVPARRTRGDLRVVCEKAGYRTSEVLYRGLGYGAYGNGSSVGLGLGGGAGNVGFGLGFGFPLGGGGDGAPARILVEMTPL